MAKLCPRCNKTYMLAEKYFHKDKSRKDGLLPICKECKNEDSLFYKSKRNSNKKALIKKYPQLAIKSQDTKVLERLKK